MHGPSALREPQRMHARVHCFVLFRDAMWILLEESVIFWRGRGVALPRAIGLGRFAGSKQQRTYMKLSMTFTPALHIGALAMALMMGASTAAADHHDGRRVLKQTAVTELTDGADAQRILAWVAAHSPEHAPMHPAGRLLITQSRVAERGRDLRQSSPPTPLPSSGEPGQTYSVSNTLSDGRHESWTYEWRGSSTGGGWILRAYELRNPGIAQQQIR